MMDGAQLVLGVDGGGTKTVAWLAYLDDTATARVVGRGAAGPANVRLSTASAATNNLLTAVDAAFADADLDRSRVASACFGLAGVDRDEELATVEEWATRNNLAERIQIVHDALPLLYAANPMGCGVALISGTGSFAFGRNAAGGAKRCGGWGHLFGDEGSGYAIGLSGLRASAHAADRRGPQTSLLDLFLQHLELREPQDLISTIYTDEVGRARIADFAKIVFRASDDGDPVALGIVQRAAGDLAVMVAATARELNMEDGPFPLALTGGVLLSRSDMRAALQTELERRDIDSEQILVKDPVWGAIHLAHRAL